MQILNSEVIKTMCNGDTCKRELVIDNDRVFLVENIYNKDNKFVNIEKGYEYINIHPTAINIETGHSTEIETVFSGSCHIITDQKIIEKYKSLYRRAQNENVKNNF